MKKIFVYLLAFTFTMSMSVSTTFGYSSDVVNVTPGKAVAQVNGENSTLDVPPKIINGRTMVPLRFIAESLNFKVDWNAKAKTVTLGTAGEVSLTIGSTTAMVNGHTVTLDSPAIIASGRTLVPLRFISESLGASVDWDPKSKIATIEYSEQLMKATALYGSAVEGEKEVLAALDDKWAYKVATTISEFGDAKDGRGFHLVGTKAGTAAAQYAYDTFMEIGLKPEFHTFDAVGWEYYASSIKVAGHENLNYFITSAPGTPPTSPEGITAEIVYIGTGTKEELSGVDLTGKIALVDFDWDYTLWPNNIEFAVAKQGAVGLIYYMTNGYGTDPTGMAEFVGDWSGKAATIPTWSMKQKEGKELAKLAEKETLKATVISDCKIIPDAKGSNVLATIKGTKYPNEYIVVNAHTDAFFKCLQDDSAPIGILMSMAKAMVDSNYKPDRSIIFVTTDGEECGGGDTFYDWLVGSWALVNDKVDEWGGKIVNAHTIEMVGDKDAETFGYKSSDLLYLFTQGMANGMNASGDYENEVVVDNYMTTSSDEWSFSYMGVPTTRTIMEDTADEVYHSTMDNPSHFSYENFVEHIKAQTTIMLRMDKQAFAPYDFSRYAEKYLASLDFDALKAQGLSVGEMQQVLEPFFVNSYSLIEKGLEMEELYKKAVADGKDLKNIKSMIQSYNNAMRATAKTVIQGTQYVALDAPVNQVSYYQTIPAVFEESIAALKADNSGGLLDIFYGLDSDDMEQFSVWYSECMDYETWVNSYYEALNPDGAKDAKYEWVTGILLKYYDFYAVLESVNKKIEAGEKNFTEEINTLAQMKIDSNKRLTAGFSKDKNMWQTANSSLPMAQADKILAELKAL